LEKNAPVWRIVPEDLSEATPPPKPDEKDVNPKFKLPGFSIHASVQTIPANKDYGTFFFIVLHFLIIKFRSQTIL
jgi:hypothetical protein